MNDKKVIDESFNSSKYWENRYKNGGNSGAGSYNHLAQFKAEVINDFIKENMINNILELGCGDGNNLSLYNIKTYYGVDVSQKAIDICKKRFKDDSSKKFFTLIEFKKIYKDIIRAEVTISLDVIYHLIEDSIFSEYMSNLFKYTNKFVIIYASNKNEGHCLHVQHRKFTDWINDNEKDWKLKKYIPNKYPYNEKKPQDTSFADFYIYEKLSI